MQMSQRCKNLHSPIRDIVLVAKKLEAEGKKIYYFNIGDPNRFDFNTPETMKNALKSAVDYGYYSDSEGDSNLIDAVVREENRKNNITLTREDVIITQGVSEGLQFMLNAIIEPGRGDEILIPGPTYPIYLEMTKFSGGVPVTYKLDEENKWQVDLDDLRSKITEKTKLICVINPNNPTGSVSNKKIVKGIIDIAAEFNLPIASDEIYDKLIFGNVEYKGVASLSKDVSIIVLNGFSKNYLATGWRCGYVYFHDPKNMLEEIKEGIKAQARQRLSACTPIMKACSRAFENDNHIREMLTKLKQRADFAHKKLNSISDITAVKPEGAFYIFPRVELRTRWKNDEDFVLDVLKNTGLVLPHGSGFDPVFGKDHFRSIILPPIEIMDEAFTKLKRFMEG
ncbi:MAG: aminotransferase class I/II-fold pyridoxal phosphate-dependent enzyme [Candidatus Aenigmatarchaeota archaeon]